MFRIYIRALSTKYASNKKPSPSQPREPVFGTLSRSGRKILATQVVENYYPDDPDGYDKEEYDLTPRKNKYYYKYTILKYANQGAVGLERALQLFEEMKSVARLKPEYKDFAILIEACSRVGYTKRAFELYRAYGEYESKPSYPMINNLINACAECPFPEYGLSKLEWFRTHLKVDVNQELNLIHYNTIIKAYGKLCHPERIANVLDEMFQAKIYPNRDTFNMLLYACNADKESGAILALRTIKRMKLYDFKPNEATYRMFLRAIRDCGLGSHELMKKTFAELPAMTTVDQRLRLQSNSKKRSKNDNFVWLPSLDELKNSILTGIQQEPQQQIDTHQMTIANEHLEILKETNEDAEIDFRLQIESKKNNHDNILVALNKGENNNNSTISFSDIHDIDDRLSPNHYQNDESYRLPNLLSNDHLDLFTRVESIQLEKISFASDRLSLFGGIHGFLEQMVEDGCKPDNRIFGLLIACLRHERHEIIELYRLALQYKIEKDVIFYDLLIRFTCQNVSIPDRLELAQYLLQRMECDTKLHPNITTYESLALGCDNIQQASQLIGDLESCGYTVSKRLIEAFFKPACYRKDFKYLNDLVLLCKARKHNPTKDLVDKLEILRLNANDVLWKHEKGLTNDKQHQLPKWFNESLIENYDKFHKNMNSWLKQTLLVEEDHPWEQFYVERQSKRKGFEQFTAKFAALQLAKHQALESGQTNGLPNLSQEASKILANQAVKKQPQKKSASIEEEEYY